MMRSFSRSSIVLIFSIIICSYYSIGQETPEITAEEIPGYSIQRNECFDGGSLWGYMNGGADIYQEYGFDILRVEEFTNEEETLKLELFKMLDPISAFGIYSNKSYRCEHSKVITDTDCLNPFQFQLLYGKYYIQLINESGSVKAKQTMINIANSILRKIEYRELLLPSKYLTDTLNLSPLQIKMVNGILGIQNKTPYLKDYFTGIDGYQIYYSKTEDDGAIVKHYEIVFDKPEMKNKFLEANKGKDIQVLYHDKNVLILQSYHVKREM